MQKGHFRGFCAFFWPSFPKGVFFRCCSSAFWQEVDEVDTRETLRNKGFRSDFTSFYLFGPLLTCREGSILRTFLEDNLGEHQLGYGICRCWDCRAELFLFCLFAFCPVRAQVGRAVCSAEGFRVFFVFFFGPRFRKLQVLLFKPPSFCLGVFVFSSHSSWDWGQRSPARLFWGCWPLQKYCFFTLKTGYFVHFSVSPFLSPWLRSLLLLSLYLSLSCFLFLVSCLFPSLFSFSIFLFFLLVLLAWFLCFCFMKKTSNITFERFIFVNSFSLFFSCFCLSNPFFFIFVFVSFFSSVFW